MSRPNGRDGVPGPSRDGDVSHGLDAGVMDRRAWLAGSLGLFAVPVMTAAQVKVSRIGLLGGAGPTDPEASRLWYGFFQGLRDHGYVDGQNVVVEGREYSSRSWLPEPPAGDLQLP